MRGWVGESGGGWSEGEREREGVVVGNLLIGNNDRGDAVSCTHPVLDRDVIQHPHQRR